MRRCSKPRCFDSATAALAYDYSQRLALLVDTQDGQASPHLYALCSRCADSLQPPRGWLLDDRRKRPYLLLDSNHPGGPAEPAPRHA